MKDLIKAKSLLESGNYTCVLCHGEECFTSTQRGIAPLMDWFDRPYDYREFCAADKVVGKATAYLYALMYVKAVYARVISVAALEVLDYFGIAVEYDELVDNIRNRLGDGDCPFEKAVADVSIAAPHIAYAIICEKMGKYN